MDRHRLTPAAFGVVIAAAAALVVPAASTVEAATFVVNDTRDRVDSRPGNGVCRTSSGTCTLRAAIQEANSRPGADVVTLRTGTYVLTRAPLNDNDISTGDLDITAPITINGVSASATIVDGGTSPAGSDASRTALDRLFEVHPGAGDVTFSRLTIREGWEEKEGGAIASHSAGTVRLVDTTVTGSFARGAGGGIFLDGGGSVALERATVSANATDGDGGGIHVTNGRLTVTGTPLVPSTITSNSARNGGGVYNAGALSPAGQHGRVDLTHTTVSSNTALNSGGGIDNRLEGRLNLTDVMVSSNQAAGDGGGVASGSKSSVTATRVTFSANQAVGSGGGAFTHTEGPVEVQASTFTANRSGGVGPDLTGDGGGGAAVYGSGSVEITGSAFTGNTAAGEGGGLAIHADGPVAVSDTSVQLNRSGASGGGILASGKVVNFTRLTVSGNDAVEAGGGIDNQGSGEFTIVDTTVADNNAAEGGGFANRADSTLVVSGSTFSGNEATGPGGGFLHRSDAATEIANTTLSGNFGFNGGGLHLDADAGLHVVNTTITNNTAPYGSGVGTADAVDNFPVASHPLLVFRNTIVAGNRLGPDCHAAFGSEGGNLDGGTLCNFAGPRDRSNVSPSVLPLAMNGGLTLTHALTIFSPAVGGGVEPCLPKDQRGMPREADRPCDVGAYEFEGTPEPPPPSGTHPETSLTSGPADTTEATDAAFTFSSDVAEATFECSLDGAVFTACVSPAEYTALADGPHNFAARAVDAAGVVDPTPASYTWTIEPPPDTTAPETSLDSTPPDVTDSRDAEFEFSADEENATFECSLDGVAFVSCVSPATYAGLRDGVHTFAVRAYDVTGNQDATPASYSWSVEPPPDTTSPETTIDAAPPPTTVDVTAKFVFSADESGSTFVCALDGDSFNACVSPVELAGLSVGPHEFLVVATDPAGNVDPSAASHSWTVEEPRDVTPPETALASGPASPTESTSAQFTFSSSESNSTFECALDGAAFVACVTGVEYTGLLAGDHTFDVRAVDPAGNADPTAESYTWTIEAPAPPAPPVEVNLDSGPPSPTPSTSARFTFSSTPPGASFQCALDPVDESSFKACSSPIEYDQLAVGDHVFAVRATDAAGHTDSALYTWTIEAPPLCPAPVTLVADADAWIDENSSTTNKGSDSILKVQSKAPRDNFRAVLHFPLPALPAGCVVETATLSIYAASASADRKLEVRGLAAGWSEGAVTWSNQPEPVGAPVTTSSGTGYRDWMVTGLVQDSYTSGSNNGFLLRDDEGGEGFEQQFHSREKGEAPPILVVAFAPRGP